MEYTNNIGKVRHIVEFPAKLGINSEFITIDQSPYTKKVYTPLAPSCDCGHYDIECNCPLPERPTGEIFKAYSMEPQPNKYTIKQSALTPELEAYIVDYFSNYTTRYTRPEELYIRVTRIDMFSMPAERWLLDKCILTEYQINEDDTFSLTFQPRQLEYFQL
jgi:hypothetical protein